MHFNDQVYYDYNSETCVITQAQSYPDLEIAQGSLVLDLRTYTFCTVCLFTVTAAVFFCSSSRIRSFYQYFYLKSIKPSFVITFMFLCHNNNFLSSLIFCVHLVFGRDCNLPSITSQICWTDLIGFRVWGLNLAWLFWRICGLDLMKMNLIKVGDFNASIFFTFLQ